MLCDLEAAIRREVGGGRIPPKTMPPGITPNSS